MILIDTSVWIAFFRSQEPYISQVEDLSQRWQAYAPECVFGELLQGAKNKREKDFLLDYWNYLPKLDESQINVAIEAGIISAERKLFAKGVGLIDAIILFLAERNHMKIWTLDKKLKKVIPKELIY